MNELIKEEKIEDMIYEIRGKQVMLDSDLAKLYECKNGTKVINQAVNRNKDRFPDDFYFQITEIEYNNLKSQFVTSSLNNNYGGVRKLPYVFTEQGVAMLATVLRTSIASEVSVKIMRAFVKMRHYISDNEYRLSNVETKVIEHDKKLDYIFSKFDKKEKLFLPGEVYDAYSEIINIVKESQNELIIIDSYADNTILSIIKYINSKVIIITSDKSKLSDKEVNLFNEQYNNKLKVIYNNTFHDRYFIIDKSEIYHIGTSINYIGNKLFSINKLEDKIVKETILIYINKILNT